MILLCSQIFEAGVVQACDLFVWCRFDWNAAGDDVRSADGIPRGPNAGAHDAAQI